MMMRACHQCHTCSTTIPLHFLSFNTPLLSPSTLPMTCSCICICNRTATTCSLLHPLHTPSSSIYLPILVYIAPNMLSLVLTNNHSFSIHSPLSLDDLGAGKTEFKAPHPSSPITAHLSVASMFSRCLASLSSIPSLNPFKHSWIKRIP